MIDYINLSEQFIERAFLKWQYGRVIAKKGEEINIYMDPIAYADSKNIKLVDAIRESGYDPKTFIFGILQYKVKSLLECFLNSHELGLDAGPAHLLGGIPVNRIQPGTLKIYTNALKELNVQCIWGFHKMLLEFELKVSISLKETAEFIAEFYSTYEKIVNDLEFTKEEYAFDCPKLIDKTTYLKSEDTYFKTVVDMCDYVESNIKEDVLAFFIHGSFADLKIVKGFSDLDTFAIVKKSVCKNAESLLKLREKIKPLWQFYYKIDPLQHHGLMLMSEFDMTFFSTIFAPFEMFENALAVCNVDEKLSYTLRDCAYDRRAFFYHIVQHFRYHFMVDTDFINLYDWKHFISTLMLVPSMFLQSKGQSVYKGRSFIQFDSQYCGLAKTINRATVIREKWQLNIEKRCLNEMEVLKGVLPWDSWLNKYHESIHRTTHIPIEFNDSIRELKNEAYLLVNNLWDEYQKNNTREIEFIDSPILYSIKDYNETLADVYIELKQKYPDIEVYLFGSVKAPGISDIDLIISTDNKDNSALNSLLNLWHNHNERNKYIFIHEPSMVVNSEFIEHIAELYPVFSLVVLSGGFRGKEIPLKQNKFQQLLSLAEISCTFFFNDMVWNYLNSRIPVRFILMRASGLNSSIKILEEFITVDPVMKELTEKIQIVKTNWFSYNDDEKKEKIFNVVKYGISLQLYIVKELDEILQKELGIFADNNKIFGILDQNIFFINNWDPQNCLRIISEAFKEYGTLVGVLPKSIGVILGSYIKFNKTLSQQFADRFVSTCGETLKNQAIEDRAELLSNHICFLRDTGLEWGGVPHLAIRPQLSKVGEMDWQKVMDSFLSSPGNHEVIEYLSYINVNNSSRLRKYLDNGEFNECIKIGEGIVKKVTNVAENYYLLGFAYQMIGEFEKSLVNYNKADALGFSKFWICYNRGQLYYTTGFIKKAEEDIMTAYLLDNEHEGVKEIIVRERLH